jgi:hypothetical protein
LPGWHSPLESQHPVGQVDALQTERWQKPDGHDARRPLHVTQTLPPVPQSEIVLPDWQTSCASQHPSGHVWKLQVAPWHTPPTHASAGPHAAQDSPPVPQSFSVIPVWQTSAVSQQPVGHVVGLHVEAWHEPVLQVSPGEHAVHAFPSVPHALVIVPDSQKPKASQQPIGQVDALHAGPVHVPVEQESLGGHGKHALAPVPHANVLVPDSHIPKLSQQPIAQFDALQVTPWHDPALHMSPGGHAVHA